MGLTIEHQPLDLEHRDGRNEARSDRATDSGWGELYKEIADPFIAALLFVALAPVILLLIVLVRATSRGPAIYKQIRLGRDGRPYLIYKIRTMTHDCERLTGPQWSTARDPRVTAVGRFLRRTHLDELPQIWNVMRGEMGLVGPRPERPEFVAKLEREIPGYRERLRVRPGITGLAQVQLPPDEEIEDVRRKVTCDLCYIQRKSPWLDLRILMATTMKVAGFPLDLTRQLLILPGILESTLDEDGSNPSTHGSMACLRST